MITKMIKKGEIATQTLSASTPTLIEAQAFA
jgi:hypothetical protein